MLFGTGWRGERQMTRQIGIRIHAGTTGGREG